MEWSRGQRCSSTLTGLASRGLKPTALPYHYESSPTYKGNFGKIRPMGELCRRRPNMERLRLCAWRGQPQNREVLSNFSVCFFEPLFLSRICREFRVSHAGLQLLCGNHIHKTALVPGREKRYPLVCGVGLSRTICGEGL